MVLWQLDSMLLSNYKNCLTTWKEGVAEGEETEFGEVCKAEMLALN
jgi:hypothetical protein